MPQTIAPPLSGHDLGFASGTTRVKILVGTGGANTDRDRFERRRSRQQRNWKFVLRNDAPDSTHGLYVKTALGVPGSVGSWTGK